MHTKAISQVLDNIKSNTPEWCVELAQNNQYIPFSLEDRLSPPYFKDIFPGRTLRTDSTIKWWLGFRKKECSENLIEVSVLMEIGDGVTGPPNHAHGGFVSTILDEVSGVMNLQLDGKPFFTVYLNVTFKSPTPAPGIWLCRAWITKQEGRKRFTYASLEDGRGKVYATSEALFLVLKSAM
eukprot:Phypoly_transcript_20785.p1 GENE.Phypoly_transcript_20785~~Phypoly_transcript_20785.p1  ORF type:complete len:181 (+),score=23.42 Phypoly_transcript_20785:64-606(+)